jgi:hypothetical protein
VKKTTDTKASMVENSLFSLIKNWVGESNNNDELLIEKFENLMDGRKSEVNDEIEGQTNGMRGK